MCEVKITRDMIEAGREAFSEYWIGVTEGYREDFDAALAAAYCAMLRVRSRPGDDDEIIKPSCPHEFNSLRPRGDGTYAVCCWHCGEEIK